MKASVPYELKTSQIKTIEQRLELLSALGQYLSDDAKPLKKQLAELREIENSKYLKSNNHGN